MEVRWMVPGQPGMAMREWFARFPAGTEAREDIYLLQPYLPGLSVKLRNGSALDVKSFLGSPGILNLPHRCRGRLEFWRKWSFPYHQPGQRDAVPAGWSTVRKTRRRSWFPLDDGQEPAPTVLPAARAGCLVELTQVHVRAGSWWSVGFEATGSAGLLRAALEHAADLVFAQALPPDAEFSLDNSLSYAQWLSGQRLSGQPGPDHRDTGHRDTRVQDLVGQPCSPPSLMGGL
jgi:hypothetical protein